MGKERKCVAEKRGIKKKAKSERNRQWEKKGNAERKESAGGKKAWEELKKAKRVRQKIGEERKRGKKVLVPQKHEGVMNEGEGKKTKTRGRGGRKGGTGRPKKKEREKGRRKITKQRGHGKSCSHKKEIIRTKRGKERGREQERGRSRAYKYCSHIRGRIMRKGETRRKDNSEDLFT